MSGHSTLLRVPDSHQSARSHVPWDEALKVLVGNTLMWRLLAADLASGFGTAVFGALYIFVAAFDDGGPDRRG